VNRIQQVTPSPTVLAMNHRLRAAVVVACLTASLSGCGSGDVTTDPGVVCNDGYTAHPDFGRDEDGCGPHGGARDEFLERVDAFLAAYPDGPAANYVCADGWRSLAVYRQGACSHHGGVASLQWPDGTQVFIGADGHSSYVRHPDGTRQSLEFDHLSPGPQASH
jgi:hypothetical protein